MDLTPADIQSAISEIDFDESFYFELKDDRVAPKKIMEEISAFSNTFGGYIFLGVSNNKQIEGCVEWNEQRIHAAIHDSITPTPSFDVKKFTVDTNVVLPSRILQSFRKSTIKENSCWPKWRKKYQYHQCMKIPTTYTVILILGFPSWRLIFRLLLTP